MDKKNELTCIISLLQSAQSNLSYAVNIIENAGEVSNDLLFIRKDVIEQYLGINRIAYKLHELNKKEEGR